MYNENVCTGNNKFCYCKALAAIAIIVLVWVLADPRIWITVLAGLILLSAGGCRCRGKEEMKQEPIQPISVKKPKKRKRK